VGILPSPANGRLFSFLCRYAGNTLALYHSSICFRADIRPVFLYRRMLGKLEMSPVRTIIFQGCVFSQFVRRQMFSLRPSEMGCVGGRNSSFNAAIPVWLEG
jgi:hypothetical protein